MAADQRIDVLYAPTNVELVVTPQSYGALAEQEGWKTNALRAAIALDQVRSAPGVQGGPLQSLFTDLYRNRGEGLAISIPQIAGDIHVALVGAVSDLALENMRTVGATVASEQLNSHSLWLQYLGAWSPFKASAASVGYSANSGGFAAGVSFVNTDELRFGLAGSYQRSSVANTIGAKADGDVSSGYIYAQSKPSDDFNFQAVIGRVWASYETAHTVGAKAVKAFGSAPLRTFFASMQGAGRLFRAGAVSICANAGIDLGDLNAAELSECAPNADYGINVAEGSFKIAQSRVGLDLQRQFRSSEIALSLSWMHALGDNLAPSRTVSSGNAAWSITGVPFDRNAVGFGLRFSQMIGNNLSLLASYDGKVHGSQTIGKASIGLSAAF